MGVFSGIEMLFFGLGALSVLLVMGMIRLKRIFTLGRQAMALSAVGALLVIFTLGWSVSSVLEGEPQAAVMGLLCFGLPLMVLMGIIRRMIQRDSATAASE